MLLYDLGKLVAYLLLFYEVTTSLNVKKNVPSSSLRAVLFYLKVFLVVCCELRKHQFMSVVNASGVFCVYVQWVCPTNTKSLGSCKINRLGLPYLGTVYLEFIVEILQCLTFKIGLNNILKVFSTNINRFFTVCKMYKKYSVT